MVLYTSPPVSEAERGQRALEPILPEPEEQEAGHVLSSASAPQLVIPTCKPRPEGMVVSKGLYQSWERKNSRGFYSLVVCKSDNQWVLCRQGRLLASSEQRRGKGLSSQSSYPVLMSRGAKTELSLLLLHLRCSLLYTSQQHGEAALSKELGQSLCSHSPRAETR